MKSSLIWLLVAALAAGVSSAVAEDAQEVIDAAGFEGGLIVHVGCGDGRLTAALRTAENYVVQGLDTDAKNVAKARANVASLGLYGPVSIERFDGRRLPYVDNLVNLVVAEDLGDVPTAEVNRVLCPGGVAYLGQDGTWTKTVKPWPDDLDEWNHWLHGPDGNAVADDRAVGPPRHAQWVAEPRWQRHHEATPSVSAVVSTGGRLFAIVNEAAAGIDGMPDRWALIARDAFNGTLLWRRPIAEWGWSQWSDHSYGHGRWNHPTHIARRLVAIDGRVFVTLGFNAPLSALDAVTGETLRTYPQTRFTDEVLYHEGTLVLVVNDDAQGPGRVAEKPPAKKSVVAIDADSGKVLWKTGGFNGAVSKADAIERVTHLNMVLGGERVFLIEDDAVVGLDLATGKRVWRRQRPPRKKAVTYGSYYFGNLCSLVYHDGVVLMTEPDSGTKSQPWNAPGRSILLGFSAEKGETLWSRPCGVWGHYNPGDIFLIDGLAWVHDGEEFRMLGLNPRTGEVERTIDTQRALDQGHHHRCYRNKATTQYFITGRRGTEFINVQSEENLRHHWVRGTCRHGVLPCNGLLYAPPHPCICYITAKLNGFWALAAERGEGRGARDEGREVPDFVEGSAFGQIIDDQSQTTDPQDWPTYRHDGARSGCAATEVCEGLREVWKAPLDGRPSSPVIAEGKVLVALPEIHAVQALADDDGKPLWTFTAGGRVDTPPTVYRGLALFGSADGWVYCLRMADGQLVWRRRAAPDDLRMMSHEQLESPWPVHGSVLIRDDVALVAAGRSSFLDGGIYIYALDPSTGNVLRQQRIFSPDPETGDMVDCRLPYDMPPDALGALPDILLADASAVYMRHVKIDPATLDFGSAADPNAKPKRGAYPAVGKHLMSGAGMLDDDWFNQTYWTVDGKSQSKLLVFDAETAYGIKPFAATARHARAIFTPGADGYTLFAARRPNHAKLWSVKVPIRVQAMTVAGPTLWIAGTPDVVDSDAPWAAFDGQRGGRLWAVSAADGKKLAEYSLDAAPTFDGMAAAGGRLYMSTADGHVGCFAGEETNAADRGETGGDGAVGEAADVFELNDHTRQLWAPAPSEPDWQRARRSARYAGVALDKVQRWLHERCLAVHDEHSGLFRPTGPQWNYQDTAADCYPFYVWAAFYTDKKVLDTVMVDALAAEQRLCNHVDRLPVPYDMDQGRKIVVSADRMIFGATEYAKDGLVPIVEITGRDAPWFGRLCELADDLFKHAPVDTPYGKIPSTNIEVNGELLQVLPRLYCMTGDREYLDWAHRLADYYLLRGKFVPTRLSDHGCEIVGGLGLLFAVDRTAAPEKCEQYRPHLQYMFGEILRRGTNSDGVIVRDLHATPGPHDNATIGDGWGYDFVGFLDYDLALGTQRYREAIRRPMTALLKPRYLNFNWDHGSRDNIADSVEGGLYLTRRIPTAETFIWADREIATVLVDHANRERLWETHKLEANTVRTVLIHTMLHTRNTIARPWQQGLQLGAAPVGEGICVWMQSEKAYEGRVQFDVPRHRLYLGFKQDWPRMNAVPEWFTVEPDEAHRYRVENVDTGTARTLSGKSLAEGLAVRLSPGKPRRWIVRPE